MGSWLATLPAVRTRSPPGTASQEVLQAAGAPWTAALHQATADLEARGLFLDDDGEVKTQEPAAKWGWEDGSKPLRQRQKAYSRALDAKERGALLGRLPRADRARLRSCGGPGAGAWLLATPTNQTQSFEDGDFSAAVRLRLGQALCLPGVRCYNLYSSRGRRGERCADFQDAQGLHGLLCKVGGLVGRRHDQLRELLAYFLAAAGYHVLQEQWEPRWDRVVRDRNGNPVPQRDEDGNVVLDAAGNPVPKVEHARLDHRWEAPPEEPRGYGDVVVSHPGAASWEARAADEDGATAEAAARAKHDRYPEDAVRPGRLTAFSVESWGRWSKEAYRFLKRAAARSAVRSPGVQELGARGSSAVLGSWLTQLSCALQKANVAMLRGSAGDARAWPEGFTPGGDEEARVFQALEDLLAQAADLARVAA